MHASTVPLSSPPPTYAVVDAMAAAGASKEEIEEIKKDPGFALSWLSKVPKPGQNKGPMNFQIGSAKNFKRLANVIHLNHPSIYIENAHLGKGGKKVKRYNPYRKN